MLALSKYYLYFFFFCVVYTIVTGMIAPMIPNSIAQGLIAVPYIAAMITVLFIFLKQQQRAPTQRERVRFALSYTVIFGAFNLIGVFIGVYAFSRDDPQVWQDFLIYIQNTQFLIIIALMVLLIAISFFLITYWFYGKQAQRMAIKMFGQKP